MIKLSELLIGITKFVPISKKSQVQSKDFALYDTIGVSGLVSDSRQTSEGCVFFAATGQLQDGHEWIHRAFELGAAFVVAENEDKIRLLPETLRKKILIVESTRLALAKAAQVLNEDPTLNMFVVGVTGTNGKTSTTYMLEHVFHCQSELPTAAMKLPMAVLGTIDHHFQEHKWETSMTTPDPVSLMRRITEMKNLGARALAMEVSSHALDQNRVDGIHFNTAIFTNLTRDHLDYHDSMADYFLAKQRFFTELLLDQQKPFHWAIVNIDDEYGRRLQVAGEAGVWTFGQGKNAQFRFKIKSVSFSRTDYLLETPYGKLESSLPMCGVHNVYNAVGVIAAATSALIPPDQSAEYLKNFGGVPGRMQNISNSKGLHIFVDYAHSPDALEKILQSLNQVRRESSSPAKIWTIFGCGGDRDKGKRPLMAQVVERLSDFVMVTSDNPRTESPLKIIEEIMTGFSSQKLSPGVQIFQDEDRRRAIETVLVKAAPGDVVVIAGKGHENYQIVGDKKHYFSDADTVKECLK